jgi:hypothetical protein
VTTQPLSEEARNRLLAFTCEVIPVPEFESWLYGSADLASALSPESYLELISANFRSPDGIRSARSVSEAVLEQALPGSVGRYRAILILRGMLNGTVPLVVGVRQLTHMLHAGCTFIPACFVGFESETDTVPDPSHYHLWEPQALQRSLQSLESYSGVILSAASDLLRELESQKGAT